DQKPAYYVDGNIHANEVQASEVALYIAWYLCEMREQNSFVRQLLKDKTFYIVPTINPDGREHFFKKPNNTHSPRSGVMPRDDDRDGSDDEDGYDDLDGDGHITSMWRKSPTGRFRPDPSNPGFMRPVPKGEFGTYEYLGSEGRDNDGDGAVNEDGPGYYDPNRDYPWNWQPQHTQYGAGYMPLLQPENRAVHEFFLSHPNIAGAMSYHNTGGMLLRGPGSASDKDAYSPQDLEPYDALGKLGELIIPGYRYITTFEDLYQTYGAETDWMHGARGVVAFTGELWSPYLMFHKSRHEDGYFGNDSATFAFDKLLLFQ
ncbi:MAG: M14 family metallopeptidase, partial [Bacteroidia bacterium]|nr:M14 family metallopeptidase [Bacteroidia bacterium]